MCIPFHPPPDFTIRFNKKETECVFRFIGVCFRGAERQDSFDWGAGDFTVFSLSSLPFYYGQSYKYIKFWMYRRKGWGCREKPP